MAKSIFQQSPLDTALDSIRSDADTDLATAQALPDLPPIARPVVPDLPSASVPTVSPTGPRGTVAVPSPAKLQPVFEAASIKYDVPVNVLMAVAEQESGYNPTAAGVQTQWGRAKGIMQYLDSTASRLGINPYDPAQSIDAAAQQLRQRLSAGYSMADAVKEHFAGPDRAKWGVKTQQYGQDVLARAARIKADLLPEYQARALANADVAKTAAPPAPTAAQPAERPGIIEQAWNDTKRGVFNLYNTAIGLGALATSPEDDPKTDALALRFGIPADQQAGHRPGEHPLTDHFTDVNDYLLQKYVSNAASEAKANPDVIGSYKNVHSLGDAGRYAVEAVFENLPMLVGTMGSGAITGSIAKKVAQKGVEDFVSKQIAEGVTKDAAEKAAAAYVNRRVAAGATAGAVANSVGFETGSIYGDTYADTGKKAPGLALGFGVPAGLLDAIEPVYALRRIAGPAVDELAASFIKKLGKEAGKQFLMEAGTEGLQSMLEDAPKSIATGQAYWTPELLDDVVDSALKGGFGGAVTGVGSETAGHILHGGTHGDSHGSAEPPVAIPAPAPVAPAPPAPEGPLGRAMAHAPAGVSVPVPADPEAAPKSLVLSVDGQDQPVSLVGRTDDAVWVKTPSGDELQIPHEDIQSGRVELREPGEKPATSAKASEPAPAPEASPQVDENGFADAPNGYKIKVARSGITGGLLVSKRKADTAPGDFYVGRDGALIPVENLRLNGGDLSISDMAAQQGVWNDGTPEQMEAARKVVEQIQQLPVGDPSRKPLQAKLKEIVTGETTTKEAVPAAPKSSTGLGELGDMAKAISAGYVDMLTERANAGQVKDASGTTNPALQVAQEVRRRRGFPQLDRNEVEQIARATDAVTTKGKQRQADLTALVDKHAPEIVDPETGEITPADPTSLDGLSEQQLRDRLKSLSEQARTNSGWTKPLVAEKKRVSAAIDALSSTDQPAPVEAKPAPPAQPAAAVALPQDLAGAKPRFNHGNKTFNLNFADDVDKAAYISAQSTPSKRDGDYLQFAQAATGLDEPGVRALGARVRDHIRSVARTAEPGTLDVPPIHAATLPGQASGAIAEAAAEAATSPENDHPEPTDAQKEAGNYRKGHVGIGGLDISIENPAGTRRRPEWPPLAHTYGYVRGSEGADGDHVDVFLGPNADDPTNPVYVVDQHHADGSFDEHKAMLGFPDEASARAGYLANYSKGWKGGRAVTAMPFDEFRQWVKDPELTRRPAAPVAAKVEAEPEKPAETPQDRSVAIVIDPAKGKVTATPAAKPKRGDENPHVRRGERYTLSKDVDYLSAGSTYEIVHGGKNEARFTNVDTDGSSTLPNWQMARALKDGVMQRVGSEPAPVASTKPTPKHEYADHLIGTEADAERAAVDALNGKITAQEALDRIGAMVRDGSLEQGPARVQINRLDLTRAEVEKAFAPKEAAATAEPPATEAAPRSSVFDKNKLFTADKVEAARQRLREKMNRLNSGVDPEALIDGMTIAGAYIEAGIRNFADFAKAMHDDFGAAITPYLRSFWEGVRNYPGIDNTGMTSAEETARQHDAMIARDGLPAEESTALGTELAPPAQKANPKKPAGSRTLRDDFGTQHIDGHSPGVKDAFLADATAYLRAVAAELRPQGFEPHVVKGKEQNPVARNAGGPAVSGEVSLTMRNAGGTNIYVHVGGTSLRGAVPTTASGASVLYRVSAKDGDRYASSGVNRWAPTDLSAVDLADTVAVEAGGATPELTRDVPEPEPAGQGGARRGVPPLQERGSGGDRPAARPDSGGVAAGEPENVGEPAGAGPDREDGVRGAGTDVAPVGRAAESGLPDDGRKRAGRAGGADDGTGERSGPDRAGRGTAGGIEEAGEPDLFSAPSATAPRVVPERVEPVLATTPGPARSDTGNFHVNDPSEFAGGGPVARFERNRAAIETYNAIRADGRPATSEEQRVLAGYTGWGSFGQELFQGTWDRSMPKENWQERDRWLRDHLGRDEWESAQRSITNAHYTDPQTVAAMWSMMKRLGFDGGRVLEPSLGIGNFFSMMPTDLEQRSRLNGIELDHVTGGMAQLLYPDANVRVMPFQDSRTPDGFYDVVIGNWPFENTVISDRRYDKLSPFLHDYFFLKAVDQVRPGGIVMGITSSGTMDKKATGIRRALAKNAELVAAYRLPSGAFQENAGTKVVTDIVILRKRAEPEALVDKTGWIDSVPMKTPSGETVSVNEYFAAHPDHVLGTIDFGSGTTRGRPGMIVHKPDDLAERLQHVAASVPEGIYAPATNAKTISFVANHTADREGALTKTDKGLFVVRGEQLAPAADVRPYAVKDAAETRSRVEQLERLVDLRQKYGALIDAERTDNAEPARKALKQAYDGFVKAHGALADSFGLSWMKRIDDPFYAPLAALEIDGKPAAVLSRSTTRGKPAIENPSIADAFVLERNASVNPSIDAVARHAGVSTDEARAELVKSGAVFELAGGDVIPAEMYLSGNVREKLRQAKAAVAEGMEQLQRNVDALERVVPADVPYFKIETQLGATWVNSDVYRDFIGHMLGLADGKGIDVRYSSGRWSVRVEDRLKSRPEAASGYGTTEYSFQRLVNAAFSNQAVTIRRKDSEGTSYVDHRATEEVNNKISEMRTKFADWLWSDPERRVAMEREYNEVRNAYATPKFDGSFLRFEGMALSLGNGPFDLRQHQADAIWRALVSRRSLNAHEVGTGKTFTIGGIAVESRRYGIARKPLILAHNANSKTVAAEIQQMYPAAKILYIDNLSPQTIDVKMRQIANDDWDAVVVPHSLIDRFSFREETLMDMAREDIAALEEEAYAAAAEDGTTLKPEMLDDPEALKKLRSPTAKELVKMRQRIVETIKKQSNRASREGAIPFEDLGVDMLMVDEAHEFKKPTISTRMQMKGLNTQTSDRSIALQFLTRYVRANNNGGNVHLFTGTPITNTLTEVFHMMRYIMSEEMQHAGVDQWDGWFGSFAREVMDVEQNAAAEYEAVTRLAGFINVPELRRMIGQYMDVVFADDMPEMQPRRTATGKTMTDDLTEKERAELLNGRTENASDRPYKRVVNVTADLTPQQKVIFDELRGYARAWREMSGKERRDAMATGRPESPIITEGLAAKASFDVRLMNGDELAGKEGQTYDDPGSKASRVVDNVKRIYDWHPKTTQVIFAEQGFSNRVTRSLGRDDAGNRQTTTVPAFSTIRDITDRLVQAGIPRDQIEIVDGSTSKDKRKEIAQKMNAAKVRVVIGSTATLGVGVNMQKNLRAMHHMDAPWMPGDLEQRNGRGLRQGNQWNTVEEYRYLTDRLDGRRWQVLAIKQRFITAFLKADDSTRTIEGDAASDDQSDILQSFAEAAGDPRILIREKIRKQLDGAQRRERLYTQGVANALGQARRLSESADEAQAELDDIAAKGTVAKADAIVADNAGKSFSAEVDGTHYDKRADADAAIDDYAANNIRVGDEPRAFGSFGGHPLRIGWPSFEKSARISLELDGRTFGGRTMQGLEQSLRGFSADTERKRQQVEERRASIQRLRALADEPFHMAGDLTRYQTALDALEADIKANPVPPPAWLRAGAPVDTDVVWRGEPFTVTGHRWNAEGWYVLAEDAKGEVSIPYTEAKDAQGLSLYDERPFERPEVVEAKTSTPKQDPANVVADEAEPAAHSIGAQHGGGFVSTEGLRQHLEQSPFGQAVKTLIDSGRIVLHDGADTLGQGKASKAPAKRGPDPERTIAVVPAGSVPEGDNFGQRRGRTQALAREQFAGKRFHNEDQDRDITVPSSAIKHSLDGKRDDDSLAAALAIPDLLREAVLVHSEPNNRGDGTKHDFFAAARIADGSIRRIKIAVVERPDGMMMYSQHIVLPHHPVVEGVPGSGAKGIGKPILAGEPDTAENVRNDRSTVKVVPGSEIGPGDMSPSLGQPGTGIKLRDLLQGVKNPNGSRIFMSKGEGVQGMTSADGRIHLVASNLTSRTAVPVLLHEMFHAGVEPLVGEKAWGNLITRLGSIYDSAVAREATADRSNTAFWRQAIERVDAAGVAPGQEAEEMAAYAIEHYAEAPAGIRSIVDRIVGTVKAWALRRFGVQAGAVTPAQLQSLAVAALRSETIVQRQGQDWSSIRSYFSRVVPTEEEVDTATPGLIHGLVTKAMDGKTSVLGAIPLRPLLQEMASGIPAAQDYLGLKQQMDQFRDSWHAQADAVAQPWLKYRMLHRAENVALMDLMHEATLAQVDPAEPFRSALTKLDRQILSEGPGTDAYDAAAAKLERENARQADHSRLQPIFDALSDTAKTIYRSVRDSYVELSDEFEKTLIANLSKALDIKANQAERAYDAEVMRIHSSAMDRAARDKAVALADKDYQRAKQIQGWSKGARMTRLRAYFETHNLEGPYFPLARFGNFFVTVRDGNDHVISFSRFESPRQQNRFAAEMRRAGHSVETGVLDDGGDLRKQIDARFVADVESILEDADVSDQVRDAVWQRWLESMPDMSIRTSRIHRKGRAGFTSDALRAFGSHMFHGAHQLARLKYALDLDESIALARDQAKTMRDPVRAGLIVNELVRRHQFVMNPTGGPLAQILNAAGYVYFLAASPAAALVNTTQTAIMGVPTLAAYDGRAVGGAARASAELVKAMRDFAAGKGHAANAKSLTDDERAAMEKAYASGLIERTQSHDLAGVADSGVAYSPVRTKVMAAISWAFHNTERFNREVTFLAGYRMARKKGEPQSHAIDTAARLTWQTHFDYQNTSRPRAMQGDTAKVLFAFRNFNANMLWRLFRDVHESVKGGTAQERREALIQLAGTTGMMMVSAGIRGTWFFGIAMLLAKSLFGDDAEDEFTKAIIAGLGHRLGGMALNGVPGSLLGIDLSDRIGMPDLWFRSPDRQLEGQQQFDYWALQLLGANIGAARNIWTGASMIGDGNVYRGVETIAPKFVKDLMRSYRYVTEGARDLKGDVVMDKMGAGNAIRQALGFTPIELTERYDRNRSMKNREQRILDERRGILSDMDEALRDGADTSPIEQRMDTFNTANPDYPVTVRSIMQSRRSSERMRQARAGGVYINPKLAPRLADEAPPLIYADDDGGGE